MQGCVGRSYSETIPQTGLLYIAIYAGFLLRWRLFYA